MEVIKKELVKIKDILNDYVKSQEQGMEELMALGMCHAEVVNALNEKRKQPRGGERKKTFNFANRESRKRVKSVNNE